MYYDAKFIEMNNVGIKAL